MSSPAVQLDTEFKRGLGLYASTMVVVGSMIGSGIFLVSAEMGRQTGSPGLLLTAWVLTGVLTLAAALSYGELAAMMPRAGGQYVYLREAFSPLWGFLYGWTLFMVIQTGTIAAVAVGFARYTGYLIPWFAEDHYLVPPIHLSSGYAVSLSTVQLLGILLVALLTWTNTRGLDWGKLIQNIFTTTKTGALIALIGVGLLIGWNPQAVTRQLRRPVDTTRRRAARAGPRRDDDLRHVHRAVRGAGRVALFRRRLEQHHLHGRRGQGSAPQYSPRARPRHGDRHLAVSARQRRVSRHASIRRAATGPCRSRGDGDARSDLPWSRRDDHGDRDHDLDVRLQQRSDPGRRARLLRHGARRRVLSEAGTLNEHKVPAWGLLLQGIWAAVLILPRTYNTTTQSYGNLYGDLLTYVISAALIFYILTIAGLFRLRVKRCRTSNGRIARSAIPIVPALYILGAAAVLVVLFTYQTATTWPGLVIILAGVPAYCSGRARVA